jgi:methionyl-tRNA formyltransferase
VRSLSPNPAARATIANTPLKILRAEVAQWSRPLVESGQIAGMIGDALIVQCGDGAVNVFEVIAPSRSPQTGASFGAPFLLKDT